MLSKVLLTIVLVVGLTGCATTKRGSAPQDLQTKINDLEKQLQDKDTQIQDLEEKLAKSQTTTEDLVNKEEVDILKATPQQIQTALKNAGFYSETIDGKVGKKTKDAIKEFQKANDLKIDGKVGKQTWSKLQKYLQ